MTRESGVVRRGSDEGEWGGEEREWRGRVGW